MRKKAKSDREYELHYAFAVRRVELIASAFNNFLRYGTIFSACWFAYLSIGSLAGQQTTADIGVNILGDLKLSDVFGVIFGGSAIVYGWRQRVLRRDTVERLQGRIRELERRIDPHRSSSMLTERGDTRPEDA